MYRADIVSYTRKNCEKSIFYLTHYTYRYTSLSFHMFYLLLIYKILTIIEITEHLSNIYRTSIGPLSNHYRTSIGPLSNHYRTSIRPLLYHYRTSIEPHQTSIEYPSNIYHYQTSIKLLLNIYQILIVRYITIIYLSIFNRTLYNHYLFSFYRFLTTGE